MPELSHNKIYNDLSGGLYTEINPLAEHSNTTLDEANFTILKNKSRKRRLGIDKVDGTSTYLVGGNIDSYFVWENAGNQAVDLAVVQIGRYVKVYNATHLVHTLDLNTAAGSYDGPVGTHTDAGQYKCDFACLKGYLFIVNKAIDPVYISWDGSTFTNTSYQIMVRDTEGLNDALDVDEKPSTLTKAHEYNLANQGWDKKKVLKYFYRSRSAERKFTVNYVAKGATTLIHLSAVESSDFDDEYATAINAGNYTVPIDDGDTIILEGITALPQLNGSHVVNTSGVTEAVGYVIVELTTDSSLYTTFASAETISSTDTYNLSAVDTQTPPVTTTTTGTVTNNTTNTGGAEWIPSTGQLTWADATNAVYPSNAQIWYVGRDEDNEFSPWMLDQHDFGNTPAAKGKFIYDAFNMNRTANLLGISSTGSATTWSDNNRPEHIEVLGGRLIYSKIVSDPATGSPDRSGDMFISQLLTDVDNAGKCYQDADPTSEDISDLIVTDGAEIHVYQALKIEGIYSDDVAVAIHSSRGTVFELESQLGFDATSYSINKSGKYTTTYMDSFVEVPGGYFFWAPSGIIFVDGAKRDYTNISLPTINTFYKGILNKDSVGYYDRNNNRVRWLCGVNSSTKYDTEVILDLDFNSFSLYSFPTVVDNNDVGNKYGHGYSYQYRKGYGSGYGPDSSSAVSGTPWLCRYQRKYGDGDPIYFAIDGSYNVNLVKESNEDFLDFYYYDSVGIDAGAYMVFADDNLNDVLRTKQVPYIGFTFNVTETYYDSSFELQNQSSCLVKGAWDYSNVISSNKWTPEFQAYRLNRVVLRDVLEDLDYGQKTITTKHNLRGSGKALAIHVRTEPAKDCHIYGWSVLYTGRGAV